MMNISQIDRLWKQYPGIENFCRRIGQLRSKQNVQGLYRRMLFLSCLSIIFLGITFLNLSKSSSKVAVSMGNDGQPTTKSKLPTSGRQPIIFSKFQYLNQTRKPSENVICLLVASFTGELRLSFNPYPRLRERIAILDERLQDDNLTDVIIFHTGYPLRADILPIIESSHRQIEFVNVDHIFYKFSPGFDPHIRDPTWAQKGKWHYHHMCYFWFTQVFKLKIMQRYRYMLRLDDDSQIQGKWPNVFEMMAKQGAIYMANQREVDFEYILPGLTRIRNLTIDYMDKKNLTAQNPEMFADIFNKTWELPNFWNNIEVIDLSFIRRPDVTDFMQAIDDSKGIFLYRWGDAPLRYVTLALFVNATQILHRHKLQLGYCHPC